MPGKSIILFDGVCNLCNGFVNFIIQRDKKNSFQFGSLQSAKVQELLKQYNYTSTQMSTVILLENEKIHTQSTAVIKIAKQLGGIWALFNAFIIVPRFIRDFLYNLVARHRYRLFGRRDACMIPGSEWNAKFIE